MFRRGLIISIATAATAVLALGGYAVGATRSPVIRACYLTRAPHTMIVQSACPKGYMSISWDRTGPQGPAGPSGSSGVVTATAVTNVANWPENSGWANDDFARTLRITRQYAAPSADCGGTPTCWFYTGTLSDKGNFTTVAGAPSPNGSSSATISGVLTGTLIGTADLEFYASSGDLNASLVPQSADGSKKPASTTDWGELALPKGTTFSGVALTAYDWTYTAPSTCQEWNDQVNPGDDGQGPADGNITGVNQCS
jgi:hypothetical protein